MTCIEKIYLLIQMKKGCGRRNSSSDSSDSSCDSSEGAHCVGGACNNGCGPCPPFQTYEPEVLSSVGCYTSCAPPQGRNLCDSTSDLSCPTVEHCVVKPKKDKKKCKPAKPAKKGCGKCGYKKCHCDESYEWSAILCDRGCSSSSDSSDSSSECFCGKRGCGGECAIIVPQPGCGFGRKPDWSDSTSTSDCPKKKEKKAKPCDKGKEKIRPKPNHKPEPVVKPPKPSKSSDDESKECEKCCYPSGSCKCGEGKAKGKSFTVKSAPKAGHPYEHRISGDKCLTVNGHKGAVLHLTIGHYYLFNVDLEDGSKMFFTEDLMGGRAGHWTFPSSWGPSVLDGAPNPMGKGVVCLKPTKEMPKIFFLQSDSDTCCGCMIVTHSE